MKKVLLILLFAALLPFAAADAQNIAQSDILRVGRRKRQQGREE